MLNLIPVCLRAGSVQARIEELIDFIAAAPENSLIVASELCISGYDFDGFFSVAHGPSGNAGARHAEKFDSQSGLDVKSSGQNSGLNGTDCKPLQRSQKSAQNPLFGGWIGSFDAILLERLQEALTPTKFLAFTHLTSKNLDANLSATTRLNSSGAVKNKAANEQNFGFLTGKCGAANAPKDDKSGSNSPQTKCECGQNLALNLNMPNANGLNLCDETSTQGPDKTHESGSEFSAKASKDSQNLTLNFVAPSAREPLNALLVRLNFSRGNESKAKIYNEFALLGAVGILHEQAKVKLFTPNFEQEIFSAGDDGTIKPFEFKGLKFGVLICFELRFTELWARLKGCDVVLVPALWGMARGEAYIALCKALAIANNCYVVASSALDFEFAGVFLPTGELVERTEFEPNLIASIKANLGI